MPRQLPRRTLLAGGLAALGGLLGAAGLAGCDSTPGDRTTPVPSADPDGTGVPTTAGTHRVGTAEGQVSVPDSPQRVVVLDTAELDSALTLGVTPVGAARASADASLPNYWDAARVKDITLVGTIGNPDLGAVGALNPDLILSNRTRDGDRYDSLTLLAPTVLTSTTGYPWKQNFQTHAQALGQQASANLVTGAYSQHISQAVESLGGRGHLKTQRISLLRFVEGRPPELYATHNFLGVVLDDLGFGRPASQSGKVASVPLADTARLADVDGSAIFYATYGDPVRAGTTTVVGSAAWNALGAVKAHQAFAVDDQLWFQGIGYTGANLVLSQMQKFLQS